MADQAVDAAASEVSPEPVDLGLESAEQVEEGTPGIPESYTVTVGGEAIQVSLEEALQGYQRQSDYTRKTQELAAEREYLSNADRLWQAIESNPQATISAIAEQYGFKLTPAQEQVLEEQRDAEDGREGLDPKLEQRLKQVETLAQQAQLDRVQVQIDRELQTIHSQYGKFNDEALLQYAVDHQIADLGVAFRAFAFENVNRVAQDKRIQQRKAQTPVAGGHGAAAGVVAPGPAVGERMSLQEAFAAAQAAQDA